MCISTSTPLLFLEMSTTMKNILKPVKQLYPQRFVFLVCMNHFCGIMANLDHSVEAVMLYLFASSCYKQGSLHGDCFGKPHNQFTWTNSSLVQPKQTKQASTKLNLHCCSWCKHPWVLAHTAVTPVILGILNQRRLAHKHTQLRVNFRTQPGP